MVMARKVSNIKVDSALPTLYSSVDSRWAQMLQIRTSSEVRRLLRSPPVARDPELWAADPSRQIDALAGLPNGYLALDSHVTFVESLLARVRAATAARNFGDGRYRLLYHGTRSVLQGGPLSVLPPAPRSLIGTGMALCGPSQLGRTALLQRIRTLLGEPFVAELPPPGPPMMLVVPMLSSHYPTCGTLRGLLQDLRHNLVIEVGAAGASPDAYSDLLGPNGPNMAIALCIALNVSVLAVDGACAESLRTGQPLEVMGFLERLQQRSGILVLLSGTPAFMHAVEKVGSKGANLGNGRELHFDPLPPPLPKDDPDGAADKDVWRQINHWYWTCGVLSPDHKMPDELPVWTYASCIGRWGWLAKGFEALLTELVKNPELLDLGALTQDFVTNVFEANLNLQSGARRVAAKCWETGTVESDADFYNYMDHLPISVFRTDKYRDWLQGTRR